MDDIKIRHESWRGVSRAQLAAWAEGAVARNAALRTRQAEDARAERVARQALADRRRSRLKREGDGYTNSVSDPSDLQERPQFPGFRVPSTPVGTQNRESGSQRGRPRYRLGDRCPQGHLVIGPDAMATKTGGWRCRACFNAAKRRARRQF